MNIRSIYAHKENEMRGYTAYFCAACLTDPSKQSLSYFYKQNVGDPT